jgi:hypothetical protein
MGFFLSDGRAENLTVPAAQVVNHGDLYRIADATNGGLNGIAIVDGIGRAPMGQISAVDTDRTIAFEIAAERIWYVKASAAVIASNPKIGAFLYWATPAADFQDGALNTQVTPATAGDPPCAFVVRRKDASGYIGVRVLNGVTGT